MFANGGFTNATPPKQEKPINNCPILAEIEQLQIRISLLEKQKEEKSANEKQTSIEHNFNVINDLLHEKKIDITNNKYSFPLAKYYDQQLVRQLEAIYNILQIVHERITKLEKKIE